MSKSNLALAQQDNPNIELVQTLYAAYGKGDLATVVAAVAPNVVWGLDGRPTDIPMLRRFNGPAGVQEFFKVMSDTHDITSFTPQEFYADADKVLVLGRYSWVMKPNGRVGESDWVHIWTIRQGKIAGFRSLNDTAMLTEAYRG